MRGFGEVAEWFKAAVLKTAYREHRHPAENSQTRTNPSRNRRVRDPFAKNMSAQRMAQLANERYAPKHRGAFRRAQWKRDACALNPVCHYCGEAVGIGESFGLFEATVDHVQPLAKGGLDRDDNYVLACRLCNQSKGSGRFTHDKRRKLIVTRALRSVG